MKKLPVLLLILLLALSACSVGNASTLEPVEAASSVSATQAVSSPVSLPLENDSDAETPIPDMADISLEGDSIVVSGDGAIANGRILTITSAGRYTLHGQLDDGQVIVSASNQDLVELVLNGVDITSASSAPIYVKSAEKVTLVLADGSQNTVTDSDSYLMEEPGADEPNAAIFSQDDLTIKGSGALTVNASYRHGIFSKDDLEINGGALTVNSLVDGLKGRDSITVKDGLITINAGGDGMQSTNDTETDRGYIHIAGGTLNITAALDGIQAQTDLFISGGALSLVTGGGSGNNSQSGGGIWGGRGMEGNPDKPTESAKGLKAAGNISISAGTININSADDAVHANNSLTVDGGSLLLSSGDDGMHADTSLAINAGDIDIAQAYEGIESAAITVNGGTILVTASDDGFNAAGGADGSAVNGRPGQNPFAEMGNYKLTINGGYIYVDAHGDGLDANGPIEMTAGTVIVNGPTANNNGALDYTGS
ncbi:MAG: carbohydrate-binding domain-containing protein, partial [Anaerolineae bacterium]|nr:carbohydrate-binding domain-containing protein [Anaerolineae bacterium]